MILAAWGKEMFEASHPITFLDYFRVPYQVRPARTQDGAAVLHQLTVSARDGDARRSLLWPDETVHSPGHPVRAGLGRYRLRDSTFCGHVMPDAAVAAMLGELGGQWRRIEPILTEDGARVSSTWRGRNGSVLLPFDPGEVMKRFWSESYTSVGRSRLAAAARAHLIRGYYLARPVLPRPVQLGLRRVFSHVQGRSAFPRWPVEDSLHGLYSWLFAVLAELSGEPVPYIGLWPGGHSWAFVLTHDVETADGFRDIELLRGAERDLGYRSSWNFVGLRYQVQDAVVRSLQDEGCEVGVHGLLHDGRDLASQRLLEKRLPVMRQFADRWGAVGFRSPSTQRTWAWMPRLGFDYDSSYTDTDPYEPQPGGCCTYLPYFNEAMIELPMTLPQDHTVFRILDQADPDIWLRKAEFLRDRNGMVLLVTHPDYARDQRVADGYRKLLDRFCGDSTAWRALPREVAQWWRERAASTIRRQAGQWCIEGPASLRGHVQFARGQD